MEHEHVDISAVLRQGAVHIGNLRGHPIFVSVDDLADPDFLATVGPGKNALVVTVFQQAQDEEDGPAPAYLLGALARGVLSRLEPLSPGDRIGFMQLVERLHGRAPGQAYLFPVHVPPEHRRQLPLDAIIAVTLPSTDIKESLEAGAKKALSVADDSSINNVIVPGLAVKWKNSNNIKDIKSNTYFMTLLSSVSVAENPPNIYVSIYKSFPSIKIEEMTAAFNQQWEIISANEISGIALHHRDLRLILLFLIIFLATCIFHLNIEVRNMPFAVLAFFTAAYGFIEFTENITESQSGWPKTTFIILGLGVISVFLPAIIKNTPEKIFVRRNH
ncbi:hypothetical protein [Nitrospirillum amazonense]|uniref:hypothetical protein n=1 Tax=Nitrospirillum amazonense TaxID=28077 RepID=UPI0011A5C1F6|nr:hypothetical protein [Nitrospirillum amazonense]